MSWQTCWSSIQIWPIVMQIKPCCQHDHNLVITKEGAREGETREYLLEIYTNICIVQMRWWSPAQRVARVPSTNLAFHPWAAAEQSWQTTVYVTPVVSSPAQETFCQRPLPPPLMHLLPPLRYATDCSPNKAPCSICCNLFICFTLLYCILCCSKTGSNPGTGCRLNIWSRH